MTSPDHNWTRLAAMAQDGNMLAPHGLGELLQNIVTATREMFGAAACSLAVLEPDEEHLIFRAAAGEGAREVVGLRLPIDRGIAGWTVSSGEAIVVENVQADPRFARDAAQSTGYLPRSMMTMPLEVQDRTYGVLEVLDRDRDGNHGEPGLDTLALFARQAALVLQTGEAFVDLGRAGGVATSVVDAGASEPDDAAELARVFALLSRLGPVERTTAIALLETFTSYTGRQHGAAGLV